MTTNTLNSSAYFLKFPIIQYKNFAANNITVRSRIREDVMKQTAIFIDYFVQDGMQPWGVAHKVYGDVHLDWLVLYANTIIDPYYQWPMTEMQLVAYIIKKYGSISTAAQTIKTYQWIRFPKTIDIDGTVSPEDAIDIDADFYSTLNANERRTISYYDYEIDANNKRKFIRLIDPIYAGQILSEYQKVFDA